jgi:UDP-N-acetylmuramoyl-L-alanyl-D-glutamate--2,6-diaminopimelate ligase
MRLGKLIERLAGARLAGDPAVEVAGISHDSRRIEAGEVFAALPGRNVHGLDFLQQALSRGAAAVLTDREPSADRGPAWITSPRPRIDTALASWALAGDPQDELRMVGVTGTNGKSTVAHLIQQMLNNAGHPAAFLGTLGYRLPDGSELDAERTTPEAPDLARLLRATVATGGRAAVMEVSSHALVMDRLAGLGVDVAVWTNLTRDHLDEHGDMETYFAAKRRLFTDHLRSGGIRVLGADDPWGAQLLDDRGADDLSWGLERGDVHADDVRSDLDGTRFRLCLPGAEMEVCLALLGVHNLRNALAASAAGVAIGLPAESIAAGLESALPLAGRLERVDASVDFPVFVDYAHTPEGLRAVLQSLRRLSERRLVVVFGAGGNRDPGKRGPMGFAVGELADVAIVTSDNPRSEDPAAIAEAVAEGVRAAGGEPLLVLDRREAIATALERSDARSLLLVAGKGHEATQSIGRDVRPFSDRAVIRELAGATRCG